MKYEVGNIVYVSLFGEIVKIEKDKFTSKITYKIATTDKAEYVDVNEEHMAIALSPEEMINNSDFNLTEKVDFDEDK